MSKNREKIALPPSSPMVPNTDFTEADMTLIEQYKEDGLPNITAVDAEKMTRMLDLYLSGKTYRQISMILGIPKKMVLYLSQRFNWYDVKIDYLQDLESSIKGKLIEAKIINQDFLLQLTSMWQKKIGNKINRYLATGNEDYANSIDLKEVDKYLKTVDMLHKISTEGIPRDPNTNTPAVGLNLGEGVTIERKGDTVEITPKNKAIGELLKQFAESTEKKKEE